MSADVTLTVVTGANGLVGDRICRALAGRGARVRAVVRRAGTAPALPGIEERTGDFTDPAVAGEVVAGASAVITTVHPMGSDRATQHRVGVEGSLEMARAAAAAGVGRFVHVSTAAVYDRSPGIGDVDEGAALVDDDAGDYAVTKRDADLAIGEVDGIARVLLRPPAILGAGPTSVWNTLRPDAMRDDPDARHALPEQTFAWVHVDDLASVAADLAVGAIPDGDDPAVGPVSAACVALNLAAGNGTQRDYFTAVTGALGVEPVWDDAPAWTGRILSDRAHAWGWAPAVELAVALDEIAAGLRAG